MAHMPEGATLIENPVSGAPGFRMENVFVMAGVPTIMRAMFETVAPGLAGGAPLLSRAVVAELPEGDMAEGLNGVQDRYPDVEIGSYPFHRAGHFGSRLVLRSVDPARLDAATAEVEALLRSLGSEPGAEDEG